MQALQVIDGCATRAKRLKKLMESLAAESKRKKMRDPNDPWTASISGDIGKLNIPNEVIPVELTNSLRVPPGWKMDGQGIHRVALDEYGDPLSNRVALAPMLLAGRSVDVINGENCVTVAWATPEGWKTKVVERRGIADSRQVLSLASVGAPVHSGNAGQIVAFLADFEAENGLRFETQKASMRCGWVDGTFLTPNEVYPVDARGIEAVIPDGLEDFARGWRTEGTWEGWLEAAEIATKYPLLLVSIYAACAAPLVKFLSLPNFIVDLSGPTSSGKTTALRFAASAWGNPNDGADCCFGSWDATRTWIERACGYLNNLPVILDETKRAKTPQIVRDVVYDFSQGKGRGRGTVQGLQKTSSWRTVLISTGESGAADSSQDAGLRARVIPLTGRPMGNYPDKGARASEAIQEILQHNYGHLGPRVLHYLTGHYDQREAFQAFFKNAKENFLTFCTGGVSRRLATYMATLALSAHICEQMGLPTAKSDPVRPLVDVLKAVDRQADRPFAAMQDLVSWAVANQTSFWGRHVVDSNSNPRVPLRGFFGVWASGEEFQRFFVEGSILNERLTAWGYFPQEIIARWEERGWFDGDRTHRTSRVVTMNKVRTRLRCIPQHVFNMVLAEETLEAEPEEAG